MKQLIAIVLLCIFSFCNATSQEFVPDRKVLYKVVNGDSLYLHTFEPKLSKKPTAAIVFFFGGGWTGGNPSQFYQQSAYFASRGITAFAAEYRIASVHNTTPFECVEDGKSAIRWVREHAAELNIDPDKIIAAGGSAGGHIALCTALIEGYENATEDHSISSIPNILIAYNPVLDTTIKGYGSKKVAGRETAISPCHKIKKNAPPFLLFHGTEDKTVPFENAVRFTKLMKEADNDCMLIAVEGQGHGFFNGVFFSKKGNDMYLNFTLYESDLFLKKHGYISGKPTIPSK
ncbi:alpha/beta hydrolase [Flavobacterium algicola]|uniref:alpha/beta hydrolase n=1 Tax=Flavobacterium algicola TaxID=556529 RepID=UPI001EFC4D23|nr:alpha/beta hydrolase [Flavobacterium algicola]MCG9791195.1 alpha/beta hydrolase [Flavobacterium algicola]